MTILSSYLFKRVIIINTIALLGISILLLFMQATKYLEIVISKGLQLKYLLYISLLTMPSICNEILPITIFISILVAWQIMINNNEMLIMQASGLTPWKISKPVIIVGLLGSVICFIFSLFVINSSYIKFLKLRNEIQNNFNIRILGSNKFIQLTKDITIYIEKAKNNGLLENVLINNQTVDNEYTIYSQTARILTEKKILKILLNNGSLQKLDKINKTVNFVNFDFYVLTIPKNTSSSTHYIRDTSRSLYLWELLYYKKLSFMQSIQNENPQEYKKKVNDFILEINKRFNNVVLSLFFAVTVAFFLSRSTFNRRTQFLPIFKCILTTGIVKIVCISVLTVSSNLLIITTCYTFIIVTTFYMIKKIRSL